MEWRKPLRCLNGSAAPVMCEWQTVLGIMLKSERSMKLRTLAQNVCGFDGRGFQQVLISSETTVVSSQQVNVAMAILYNSTTAHYYAIHTQRFLGYDDTLCIQVSLFLRHISTYFYSVTPAPILSVFPALSCALRIKKCAPRISSGIYFFM